MVKRVGVWVKIQSDQLLPGDLISVVRPRDDEQVLACDILLLSGRAVVNEAMLTGESTPLMKERVSNTDSPHFDLKSGVNKASVLYGGTKVLQTVPDADG